MSDKGTADQIAQRYLAVCEERDELRAEVERKNQSLIDAGRQLAATEDYWQAEVEHWQSLQDQTQALLQKAISMLAEEREAWKTEAVNLREVRNAYQSQVPL